MILSKKIRLRPTTKQEQQLWKSAGTARFTYNWALSKQIQHFEKIGKLTKIPDGSLRKELTQLKQCEDYAWLYEVSNNVAKQAVKDVCNALDRFHKESKKHGYRYRKSALKRVKQGGKPLTFRDFEDFPRFKKKNKAEPKFFNDNVKLKVKEDKVLLEKVGWIKFSEIGEIPTETKYTNPRITYDGKYWYLTVGFEQTVEPVVLNEVSLGIDVGIKDLATCSDGTVFKNINKTQTVKKLEKRLRRLQRQVSRKYELNKIGKEFVKTENIIKLEKRIRLVQRRLTGSRNNHIHQTTIAIVKTKPSRIVVEDLNAAINLSRYELETKSAV